jgi:5'-deoxynucleotidase YfbR-like HD superfamily hydrolase
VAILEIIRRAQAIREGGHTQRMHTCPVHGDASNAKHQWNMAVLYLQLHPAPQMSVLQHILLHDVAERWVGDTPAPAKYSINPQLGKELHKAELEVELALGLDLRVLPEDQKWVKALDILELFMYCHDQIAMGNMNLHPTLHNCTIILKGEWVPEVVRDFAASYRWERTMNIVPGEVMNDGLDSGLR